ncbi:hypothetical protein QOZ80_7AG0569170 [Eleusine coracana subsp. coracana]|nr:hypothetical protein QOZ80_7AG0569170 [Eleusine coracana subsp. coracana]
MASTQQQLRLGEDETGGARAQAVRGTGRGKSRASSGRRKVTYGFHLVEGRMLHGMEDVHVAEFRHLDGGNEVGLFAVFDGHSGADVATYLREHLFDNILNEPDFWTDTLEAIRRAYHRTDRKLLKKTASNGDDNEDGGCGVSSRRRPRGGSTAVTVILINGETLVVANVGDSRAVLCGAGGEARQLSVDHEPLRERDAIESRGGFVTEIHGDVPRVDAQLAMSRAFGDRSIKEHISSDPDVAIEDVGDDAVLVALASEGCGSLSFFPLPSKPPPSRHRAAPPSAARQPTTTLTAVRQHTTLPKAAPPSTTARCHNKLSCAAKHHRQSLTQTFMHCAHSKL